MQQSNGSNQDRTRARQASARQEHAPAGVGAVSGSNPSNTDPAICTVLRSGVDSLYLSFQGELSESGAIRLEEARRSARSEQDPERPLALVSLLDHRFVAGPSAGKLYRYLIEDHCYRIQFKKKTAERLPLAYAKIDSTFLTSVGVEQAVDQLRLIVSSFGVVDPGASVSRLDLFVDFVSPVPLDSLSSGDWVSRAKDRHQHWDGLICTGWSIGKGKLMARLYDKTLEIKKSGKVYLYELWKQQGWDGVSPVYRLEFQFRNEALRELKYNRYPDILEALGGLWRYAMMDWLRLCIQNLDDQTRSRWETHPLWAHLRDEVPWKDNLHAERSVVLLDRAPPDKRHFQFFFAALTSFMGAKGLTDPREATRRLFAETEAHFERYAEYRGEGFYGQAVTRAATKAMEYRVPYPGMAEAAQARQNKAVADAYRLASGR